MRQLCRFHQRDESLAKVSHNCLEISDNFVVGWHPHQMLAERAIPLTACYDRYIRLIVAADFWREQED